MLYFYIEAHAVTPFSLHISFPCYHQQSFCNSPCNFSQCTYSHCTRVLSPFSRSFFKCRKSWPFLLLASSFVVYFYSLPFVLALARPRQGIRIRNLWAVRGVF